MIHVINLIVILLTVFLLNPSSSIASSNFIPSAVCLGNCPTPIPASAYVTYPQPSAAQTPGVYTNAVTPTERVIYHTNNKNSNKEKNNKDKKGSRKGSSDNNQGLIQFILEFIKILLQLIQQILGSYGIATVAPTIMPSQNPSPSSSGQLPSATPPLPTSTITIQPTGTQPSATPAPSLNPTSTPTPTQQIPTPTGQIVSPPPVYGENYSGYYFKILSLVIGDFISTTFTAVAAACGTGNIAPWPGMGDTWDVEDNLAQLGIDIECQNGTVRYLAWTEALPAASVYPPNTPIQQGDTITATITYQGSGRFTTNLTNITAGWSVDTPMIYSSNYVPVGAEVINEEVMSQGVMSFSPLTLSSVLTIGGQQVQMANQPGLTRLNFESITTSDLNGSTFISTYSGN